MNILLVSGPGISLKEPYDSGIEAFMVSFANQLSNEGHKVDVVAEKAEAGSKFNLINPFNETSENEPDYFKNLTEKDEFKTLDIDSYDIIHFNMFYPHLIEAGLDLNKTVFLTLHTPADDHRISIYKKLSRQNNLKFVAISQRIKDQYERALNIDIPLINNGINTGIWYKKDIEEPEYLLWSARITKEKNPVAAIRVAQYMKLPLKIAGRIVDQKYFDDEVKPHLYHQIQYVGHVTQSDLSTLSKKAIAYLATATWQEPFGLAALEMLASGLPVVGFNTAVPQVWDHESVLTTQSHHWQDLVELIQKSRYICSDSCRNFASNMNIQKMTSDYLALYREVLSDEHLRAKKVSKDQNLLEAVSEAAKSLNDYR